MRIRNLTPHVINIHGTSEGEVAVLHPDGVVPRVSSTKELIGMLEGIPIYRQTVGEIVDLPAEEEGVFLVVSLPVRLAVPHRGDVASPGDLLRDAEGRPVGCLGLHIN